jgi:hypothetical protein
MGVELGVAYCGCLVMHARLNSNEESGGDGRRYIWVWRAYYFSLSSS